MSLCTLIPGVVGLFVYIFVSNPICNGKKIDVPIVDKNVKGEELVTQEGEDYVDLTK